MHQHLPNNKGLRSQTVRPSHACGEPLQPHKVESGSLRQRPGSFPTRSYIKTSTFCFNLQSFLACRGGCMDENQAVTDRPIRAAADSGHAHTTGSTTSSELLCARLAIICGLCRWMCGRWVLCCTRCCSSTEPLGRAAANMTSLTILIFRSPSGRQPSYELNFLGGI